MFLQSKHKNYLSNIWCLLLDTEGRRDKMVYCSTFKNPLYQVDYAPFPIVPDIESLHSEKSNTNIMCGGRV